MIPPVLFILLRMALAILGLSWFHMYFGIVFSISVCVQTYAHSLQIFSPTLGCPFTLLIVSFAVQKPFSLIRCHLFIFVFVVFAFRVLLINSLPKSILRRIFPRLSSRTFMVSGLRIKSLIHLELIFV